MDYMPDYVGRSTATEICWFWQLFFRSFLKNLSKVQKNGRDEILIFQAAPSRLFASPMVAVVWHVILDRWDFWLHRCRRRSRWLQVLAMASRCSKCSNFFVVTSDCFISLDNNHEDKKMMIAACRCVCVYTGDKRAFKRAKFWLSKRVSSAEELKRITNTNKTFSAFLQHDIEFLFSVHRFFLSTQISFYYLQKFLNPAFWFLIYNK
jgi:hypothetical protein